MTEIASSKSPQWIYPQKNEVWKKQIVSEFNIHPVSAQILIARGFETIKDIHEFLYAKLPSLHSPFLFADMDKAVNRILLCLKKKEGILIFGDNDVDGITGVTLLTEILQKLGGEVKYYLPNRSDLKKNVLGEALFHAKKNNCKLLITVDCGITAAKEIEIVTSHNVDVIVTDHHEPTSKVPNCIATLNPKLINSIYPNRDLTGVGVAFKLCHALIETMMEHDLPFPYIDLKDVLDLVALGTIADMGALVGENRILVRYGLNILRKTKRIGLIKLFNVSEIDKNKLTTVDIASKVAPRLNSLGRIADPTKGVDLLLCKNETIAEKLAEELDLYNLQRQKIERTAYSEIEDLLQKRPSLLKEKAIVLYSEKWHPGVIPILTAKIAKLYNKPTIVIAIENGVGKASLRTIPEFPLLPILYKNKELLINFGGHDYAAGLTIKADNIQKLQKSFIKEANEALQENDLVAKLFLDSEIQFEDLSFDFMESMNLIQPFGNENPAPILYTDVVQAWPPKVVGKSHLKFFLQQEERSLEGIGFNLACRRQELLKKNTKIRIAFTPYVNVFLNKSSIQLQIKDFIVFE